MTSARSSNVLTSVCRGLLGAFDRYHDGRPFRELISPSLDLRLEPKVESFFAKKLFWYALGVVGTQRTRKPAVISPWLQRPIGPTMYVMSSDLRARTVDQSRKPPHTQPLCMSKSNKSVLQQLYTYKTPVAKIKAIPIRFLLEM